MRWARRLALLAFVLLILTWGSGAQEPKPVSPCRNPTLTVGPDEDLQGIIDRASPGAVVELQAGTYLVRLKISKSLALCGQGIEQTRLQGARGYNIPVIRIESEQPIRVILENLTVAGDPGNTCRGDLEKDIGLYIGGRAGVRTQNVSIQEHCLAGIRASDFATVIISNSQITRNGFGKLVPGVVGSIGISGSAQATIEDSQIFENAGGGISVDNALGRGAPRVTIRRSQVFGNFVGILINVMASDATPREPTQVAIEGSEIFRNEHHGISIGTSVSYTMYPAPVPATVHVSLTDSSIIENGKNGISIGVIEAKEATFELRRVTIEQNGTDPICLEVFDRVCNGILLDLQGRARVTIADAVIRRNTDWGVAAYLEKCGYPWDNDFVGEVIFEGANVIEGNNTAGNHQGEVCLP